MNVRTLPIDALSPTSFAPYGDVMGWPADLAEGEPGYRSTASDFVHQLSFDTGIDGGPAEVLWVHYRDDSSRIDKLEMHRLTHQAVVPIHGGDLVQIVCLDHDGGPDIDSLKAFRLPQGLGVSMHPGCWHATRTLDGEVTALMLTRHSTTRELVAMLTEGAAGSESRLTPLPAAIELDVSR
ncbi:ureidoglycolate lyase [Salinicola lusitanus]|uniref:ureidoglycolate lyase n=1 Tax=Salinicola lusitanus TaxID=1949085 RepID=UPI000DA17DFA|nr:ureidoglycolate lyase [Salinicola lusitanus]